MCHMCMFIASGLKQETQYFRQYGEKDHKSKNVQSWCVNIHATPYLWAVRTHCIT